MFKKCMTIICLMLVGAMLFTGCASTTPTKTESQESDITTQPAEIVDDVRSFDESKIQIYYNDQQIVFPMTGKVLLDLGFTSDAVVEPQTVSSIVIGDTDKRYSLVTGVNNKTDKALSYAEVPIVMIQGLNMHYKENLPLKVVYDGQTIDYNSAIDDVLSMLGKTTFEPEVLGNETTYQWYGSHLRLTIRVENDKIFDISIDYL